MKVINLHFLLDILLNSSFFKIFSQNQKQGVQASLSHILQLLFALKIDAAGSISRVGNIQIPK
jgi:hypothetical protein